MVNTANMASINHRRLYSRKVPDTAAGAASMFSSVLCIKPLDSSLLLMLRPVGQVWNFFFFEKNFRHSLKRHISDHQIMVLSELGSKITGALRKMTESTVINEQVCLTLPKFQIMSHWLC